jgi:hypothetical protein
MAVIDLDLHPDRTTLRRFGFASLVMFGLVAVLGHVLWNLPVGVVGALGGLAVLSGVFAAVEPRGNLPLYLVLNVVFYPVGFVMSYVVLGVLFFVILTPLGFVFRLMGRDALRRSMNHEAPSYWIPHRPAKDVGRYFRPF